MASRQLVCQISINQGERKQTLKTRVISAFSVSTFGMHIPRAPRRAVSSPEAAILLYSGGGGSGDEIGRRAYSLANIFLKMFFKGYLAIITFHLWQMELSQE